MKISRARVRSAGVLAVSGLAFWAMASGSDAPRVEVRPGTPSAKAPARFLDRSPAGTTSWLWNFGDGTTSTDRNPTHIYEVAGVYPVTLRATGPSGTIETTLSVSVVQENTLSLLVAAGHPFQITLHARDPRTGNEGDGEAIPQNDVFGYFTIPTLVPITPGAPVVPEVFVKMLDARGIPGQDFWVFWGGLTDLEYTLTVTDVTRGTRKEYHNPASGSATCLGADTSGFVGEGGAPTPTPTPPPGSVHVVNVGQGGNLFTDAQSGGRQTTIRVGESVQWNWMGGPHSSTSGICRDSGGAYGGYSCDADGNWSSGSHSSGFQYSKQFNAPGTFRYYCEVHGQAMTGTVIVNDH
jgi:plastocyanin